MCHLMEQTNTAERVTVRLVGGQTDGRTELKLTPGLRASLPLQATQTLSCVSS